MTCCLRVTIPILRRSIVPFEPQSRLRANNAPNRRSCVLPPASPGYSRSRATRRGAHDAGGDLRLVHRGLRHRRPVGRQDLARRVAILGQLGGEHALRKYAEATTGRAASSVRSVAPKSRGRVRNAAPRTNLARTSAASAGRLWKHLRRQLPLGWRKARLCCSTIYEGKRIISSSWLR